MLKQEDLKDIFSNYYGNIEKTSYPNNMLQCKLKIINW